MKTYTYLVSMALTVFLVSCSKSNVEPIDEGTDPIKSNYSVLLKKTSGLSHEFLSDTSEGLTISEKESLFPNFPVPEVNYRADFKLSFYTKTGTCSGEVLLYDFDKDTSVALEAFTDLEACNLSVTAIAHTDKKVFISYVIESAGKDKTYFIRTFEINTANKDFTDIELTKKPIEVVPSNNRLFVLTLDEEITDENGIVVIELSNGEIIHEANLGYYVGKIFENPNGDIIISYPELHTTFNAETLAVVYTPYGEGTEPNFVDSESISFDLSGKMYYQMKTNEDALTETIPAVYDFSANTAVLYYFENFLTDSQLNVEFGVSATTALAYDEKNNLILIGYKKKGGDTLGGILRITPSPDLTFKDNVNLDGVPYSIFVQ